MKAKPDPQKAFRIPSLKELPSRQTPLKPSAPPLPEFTPTREGALPTLGPEKGAAPAPPPERGFHQLQGRLKRTQDQLEDLRRKLQKAERALREAVRERDKAKQEASLWRKEAAGAEGLREEVAALRKALEEARRQTEALQEEVKRLKGEREALLEKTRGAARWERAEALREKLPEPFPLEAFFQMLFIPYPELGASPEARLLALAEGYRALLRQEEHPLLSATNRDLLSGEPEGIVILGVERLLLDLAESPLPRWLRTHAWLAEARLIREKLSSPREEE